MPGGAYTLLTPAGRSTVLSKLGQNPLWHALQRRSFNQRIAIITGLIVVVTLVLLPVVSEPVHDSLADASSSVSGLVGWGLTDEFTTGNASDGALRAHGRKDNFRENLRPDLKYIMSGFHSGWTNDVMMGVNLIHLGLLTGRIPIVFPFPPSLHLRYIDDAEHIPPAMPFDRVFDLPRLSRSLGIPIVQIEELKTRIETKPLYGEEVDLVHPKEEEIGGWSTWMVTNPDFFPKEGQTLKDVRPAEGRRCYQLDTYRIKPSFVPIPESFKPVVDWTSTAFDDLTALFQPQPNPFATYYLRDGVPAYFGARGRDVPAHLPEDHVLYIDFLYNLGEGGTDGRMDWTGNSGIGREGAWETVGRFMRWEPVLEELARGYLRRAFGVKDKARKAPPPFIAVHIRRSDIGNVCKDLTPEELAATDEKDCYSSLAKYVKKVDLVRARLAKERGIKPKFVVATTDEHDEAFLSQVREQGWLLIDHDGEQTVEKYGLWYPTLLDSVILSQGVGFVGTSGSTMSILARRRVEVWNNGIGTQVPRRYGGLEEDNDPVPTIEEASSDDDDEPTVAPEVEQEIAAEEAAEADDDAAAKAEGAAEDDEAADAAEEAVDDGSVRRRRARRA